MTPFSVVVTWSDRPVATVEAARLLEPIASRCSDDRAAFSVPGASVAVGLRAATADDAVADGFIIEASEGWAAVGDVRLYDRSSIQAAFGTQHQGASDLALMARAYRRFGDAVVARTAGDFAFVIWDWRARQVHALRDHFGLRPIFLRRTRDGLALASDVRQLLAVDSGPPEVDPQMVLQHLSGRFTRPGLSFFSSVRSVLPAHVLAASADHTGERRYWTPSFAPIGRDYRENIEEWRRRFRSAVQGRLPSHRPVAAYLSGGFDSSSIVGAAHEAFEGGLAMSGRPIALSAEFRGFPCDETPWIDAVLARCPSFESARWDGTELNSADFERPQLPLPCLVEGVGRGPRRENEVLIENDCRIVLKGHGGDALAWSFGVLADLARSGRWWTLCREVTAFAGWRRAARVVRTEAALLNPFETASEPPEWYGPLLRHAVAERKRVGANVRAPSRVQLNIWNSIGGALTSLGVEWGVQAGADAGVEVRVPYLDLRLVDLVLGIPWDQRLPHGDVRRLQREAAAPFLPAAVTGRPGKVFFGVMLLHQIRMNLPRIWALFRDRDWVSHPFVDQGSVRRNLQLLCAQDPKITRPGAWAHIWEIAVFEAWLRMVFGYDASPRGLHE